MAIATLDTRTRATVSPVLSIADFQQQLALVARLPVPEVAVRHAVDLARASRPANGHAWVKTNVAWGAGPRASQALVAAARARAALLGLPAVGIAEIRAVAPLVLAHRVVPSFSAQGQGIDGRAIAAKLLELVSP